jgi:hypothetical protein
MDRFLALVGPDANPSQDELLNSTWDCFEIGASAAAFERVFAQAHEKETSNGLTRYWFFPGKVKGQEGDLAANVTVRDDSGVKVNSSAGIVIR